MVIRGTLSETFYEQLGLDTLNLRRRLRKLCLFYKLLQEKSPAHLFQVILENRKIAPIILQEVFKKVKQKAKTNFFKTSFFAAVVMEWNNLDVN